MESKDRKPHDYPHLRVSEPALDDSGSSMSDSTQRVRAELGLSDGSKQHRHQGGLPLNSTQCLLPLCLNTVVIVVGRW